MMRPAVLVSLVVLTSFCPLVAEQPAKAVKVKAGDSGSPAPPIPEPPADPLPPIRPAAGIKDVGPAPVDDPFQQTPRDGQGSAVDIDRASEAFAAKRYSQAAALFAESSRRGTQLTATQRDEWAYSRLHAVALRLSSGKESAQGIEELGKEIDAAVALGSERLRPFGKQLRDEVNKAAPPKLLTETAASDKIETPSFRVLFDGKRELAVEVGAIAEAARKAMYERWVGPPAGDWSPRCEIYLHASSSTYAKATGKAADRPGHSTVGLKSGQVATRRIDLRADETTMLDCVLPHEVTQVVLAEMFSEQALPRWAAVGMAALAESPEGVARYRRSVPALLKEKKLFAVGPFMERSDFCEPANVTAFYAESVSLVAYLVELKGPKAFATFLREAPRRGYAKALTTYYGFKDPAELQDRWIKHTLGGE